MMGIGSTTVRWQGSLWQKGMWGGAAALLALPAVAMQFTREVNWDASDFIVMGIIITLTCLAMEVGMRMSSSLAYRAGVAVGVGGAFLMVWINLAVGALGSEDNDANVMYVGVLLIGMVGAVLARFRAAGLVKTMLAMAVATVLVAIIAIATGSTDSSPTAEVAGVTLFFIAPWLLSAALFHVAHADVPARDAA